MKPLSAPIFILVALISASKAFAIEVPIRFVPNGSGGYQMFMPCSYEGFFTDCYFDSGSGNTAIANNDQTKNLAAVGKVRFGGAAGTIKECDQVKLETFRLDSFIAKEVLATRCEDSQPSNVWGMNVLANTKRAYFDLKKGILEIDGNSPELTAYQPLRILSQGHLIIPVNLTGESVEAFWDTGAGLSVVDQDFVKDHASSFQFVSEMSGHDATGTPVTLKLYKVDYLVISGVSFKDSLTLAMPFQFGGDYFGPKVKFVVGTNHMQAKKWDFDLKKLRWSLAE